ncbi:MAG: GNAT family N-acetyltransferase [Lachnospiraceae bacterium]|nr:GNAT family N-acetyltransferase [Lachnospiraceae bacterium]
MGVIRVNFYEQAADEKLKYAVIVAKFNGKWVWCKHRERNTYEIPGGHREPGERIWETARRELYEETGATVFELRPVCVYSVVRASEQGETETFGMLYYAEIAEREEELHSEIERIALFDELPGALTYPDIQPFLFRKVLEKFSDGLPDAERRLRNLLALEFNADPEDFLKKENILTLSALHEGRRQYCPEPYFFHMVTTGGNAVVTADKLLHPFLKEWIGGRPGHWLFEIPNLHPLERELNKFGYSLTATHHMFLPAAPAAPQREYPVKWFYDEEIRPFYGDKRFPNALCPEYLPHRPDRIAVCAYDGEKIMGMAGCSEDAPHWQQIGIDVMPEYRSQGVGTYLVTLLKNEILARGELPFYGTSVSNYHSWNIALNCGFRPAWVEIGAEREKNGGE